MKKTTIAIWGNANQGKSSSIREIATLIETNFPKVEVDYRIIGVDILVIITIGKIKIGIESQGDPGSRLEASLKLFVEEGCDIIICSTRTRGATVWFVEALNQKHGYDIIWTSNYFSWEKSSDQINRLFAEHIVNLIKQLIDGNL